MLSQANRDVVEMLISLSESENKSIARAANGAWWVLNTDERERQLGNYRQLDTCYSTKELLLIINTETGCTFGNCKQG